MTMQQQYRGYAPQGPPRPGTHAATPRRGGSGFVPMMSTPGGGGPGGPHPAAPMPPSQLAAQQQQQQQQQHHYQQASQLAKLRSRKPTDKALPDGIGEMLVDPDIADDYNKLRDFERRLDATMTRKRLDVFDAVGRNAKRFRTLRIWISNTVEDQPWQSNMNVDSFDFSANLESSYRVKIEGRLLDDEDEIDRDDAGDTNSKGSDAADHNGGSSSKTDTDTAEADASNKTKQPQQKREAAKTGAGAGPGARTRFSHFFKALTVDYDGSAATRGAAEASVEWKKPDRTPTGTNLPAAADFDELTFKRNGDENANVTISMFRHEEPERFLLSPDLADIVDMTEATSAEAVMGMWDYIKLMNLQEDEEKRNFRCDDLLKKIIGRDSGSIPQLQDYINGHLLPLPPVKLAYTIRVDEDFHRDPKPTVHDVRVAVDDPMRARLLAFYQNPQYAGALKEVAALDDQLATLAQAVAASQAKHTFFMSLCDDPVRFFGDWLSSQKRDLEVILGEATRGGADGGESAGGDEWRRGGRGSVWGSRNARESVNVLLAKQPMHPR